MKLAIAVRVIDAKTKAPVAGIPVRVSVPLTETAEFTGPTNPGGFLVKVLDIDFVPMGDNTARAWAAACGTLVDGPLQLSEYHKPVTGATTESVDWAFTGELEVTCPTPKSHAALLVTNADYTVETGPSNDGTWVEITTGNMNDHTPPYLSDCKICFLLPHGKSLGDVLDLKKVSADGWKVRADGNCLVVESDDEDADLRFGKSKRINLKVGKGVQLCLVKVTPSYRKDGKHVDNGEHLMPGPYLSAAPSTIPTRAIGVAVVVVLIVLALIVLSQLPSVSPPSVPLPTPAQ